LRQQAAYPCSFPKKEFLFLLWIIVYKLVKVNKNTAAGEALQASESISKLTE